MRPSAPLRSADASNSSNPPSPPRRWASVPIRARHPARLEPGDRLLLYTDGLTEAL